MKLQNELLKAKEYHKNNFGTALLVKAIEAGLEKLDKYFQKARDSETASIATILNPYHKLGKLYTLGWTSEELARDKKAFLRVYEQYRKAYGSSEQQENEEDFLTDDEEPFYGADHPSTTSEPEEGVVPNDAAKYLTSQPLKQHRKKELDITYKAFWKAHESPILAKMARDYGSIMATSVPSEAVFSIAGEIITKKRNKLATATMEKIMCLKSLGLLDDVLIAAVEVLEEDEVKGSGDEELKSEDIKEEKAYDLTRKGDADLIIV